MIAAARESYDAFPLPRSQDEIADDARQALLNTLFNVRKRMTRRKGHDSFFMHLESKPNGIPWREAEVVHGDPDTRKESD